MFHAQKKLEDIKCYCYNLKDKGSPVYLDRRDYNIETASVGVIWI